MDVLNAEARQGGLWCFSIECCRVDISAPAIYELKWAIYQISGEYIAHLTISPSPEMEDRPKLSHA